MPLILPFVASRGVDPSTWIAFPIWIWVEVLTFLYVWTTEPSCRSYAASFPLITHTFCLAIGRLVCERVNAALEQGHVL